MGTFSRLGKTCGLSAGLFATLLGLSACPSGKPTPAASASETASEAAAAVRFEGSDIRREQLGGDFTLTAHDGRTLRLSDFQGKVVVLVFGFTHCPDVCPTHLLTYSQALALLTPEEAAQVQLLFVSVDPSRDRPELLAQYVPAFDPHFIGLTTADGSEEAAFAAMKLYGATAAKQPPREGGFYLVDHSTGTFLLDRNGRPAVLESLGQSAAQLAHDLRLLLNTPR